MSARRIVLLRHGRTAWNHAGRVQGQSDVDLDAEGLAQADRTAPVLAALNPALLWSSDLVRTRQTVAPLASVTALEVRYDAGLREFCFGEREGLTHEEFRSTHPAEFGLFRTGHYDAVPSAERTVAVRARMVAVLDNLLTTLQPGQTGIAVSHGAAIRVVTGALLGWPDDQFHTLRGLDNCGWAIFEEGIAVARLRLRAYNCTVPAAAEPLRQPD